MFISAYLSVQTTHVPTSGPWHVLTPWPGMLFPQIFFGAFPYFKFLLECYLTKGVGGFPEQLMAALSLSCACHILSVSPHFNFTPVPYFMFLHRYCHAILLLCYCLLSPLEWQLGEGRCLKLRAGYGMSAWSSSRHTVGGVLCIASASPISLSSTP